MTIQNQVLQAIAASERYSFPEDVSRIVPAKSNTIRSACFELATAGKVHVARKSRDNDRTACVFWVRSEQIAGIEKTLMPYEKAAHAKRKTAAREKENDEPDMLFSIPGENGTLQLKFSQAEALYRQLHRVFGAK